MKNIAIISPSQNAYSESFIQAHRKIKGNIFFYYSGELPSSLEGKGVISYNRSSLKNPIRFILKILNPSLLRYPLKFSLKERLVANSFRTNQINYVLAEYGTTAVKIMNICKYLNIPLIAHFHGYDISVHSIIKENLKAYEDLFKYAYKVIVVSRLMQKNIIKLGCEANKILYNPCGADDTFYDILPKFNSNNVLSVGRFVDKKSPYYLILAFKEVLKEIPKARLLMIGVGPLWESCKNIAKYLNIDCSIDFLGIVDHKEIQKYYANSDVFVQSSITSENGDQEGTPVSVMEASLAGLPVVSTKHAGIPDVILAEKTGILLDEHDVKGLANAIILLLKDKEKAKTLGIHGKHFINSNFKQSISIERINSILE